MGLSTFLAVKARTFGDKVLNIVTAFCAITIWAVFISTILSTLAPFVSPIELGAPNGFPSASYIYSSLIRAPLWEELYFRWAPLTIALVAGRALKVKEKFIIPTMVLSSVYFGLGHSMSPDAIAFHAVMGFVFAMLYVKNNYSYWSSVTLHFMWNAFCLFIN